MRFGLTCTNKTEIHSFSFIAEEKLQEELELALVKQVILFLIRFEVLIFFDVSK